MDYPIIVCLIRISGCRKLCPWSHCLIGSVLSYLQLAWMNSAILSSQLPYLLSCLTKCFRLCFYRHHSCIVRAVEPCLFPLIFLNLLLIYAVRIFVPWFSTTVTPPFHLDKRKLIGFLSFFFPLVLV